MPNHQSAAGVIVFHVKSDGTHTYLVIKNSESYWEFPKGHPTTGETWKQTALRELEEETGIYDLTLISDFSRKIRYFYRDGRKGIVDKTVCFALGQTPSNQIVLSHEHTDSAFLNFDDAMRKLTHAGTRALLRDAEEFIRQYLCKTTANVEFASPSPNNGPQRKAT